MLDDGMLHEHDIVDRIRSKGTKVLHSYSEGQMLVHCYDEGGVAVLGHPDGVMDVTQPSFELDYADEEFRFGGRYYGLEVTAPGHFNFLRLERSHMRSELWRKFVQIQMYLNSEELRAYSDCMVVIAKNKNTSALYEEGISFDMSVVTDVIEKLKRVGDLVFHNQMSSYRCADWRRHYCRYRELCFGIPEEVVSPGELRGILEGESLSEAEQLLEAADLWVKGKSLEVDGKELIEEARALFGDTIAEYGAKGLTVGPAKAQIVVPVTPRKSIEYDILKQKYPEVYDAVVTEKVPDTYLMVSKR